ncbi:hypothetical protein SAVERM_54 [Streptomyces avermitilis MA-4680 = NBRC 14893]|uniref:Uncharacterized protein n=1 Tax=Streptomyces avermitilis (strain ATCC 31267 / DSM 46492 / JCM 5070 / NBRC 14893 / NCIMB 12804 / NRRL 8165 / MA-4680) TaxID=227882 RepID=Q82RT9_STRAW|nr:hypothetical protein SAVERM_54 [Streptomyces avermitilis MA-4680 = NBRC 14893]
MWPGARGIGRGAGRTGRGIAPLLPQGERRFSVTGP